MFRREQGFANSGTYSNNQDFSVYRVDVRALVFGPVGAVGKGFATRRVLAQVGLLARVRPQVNLEVFQPGKGLGAAVVLHTSTVTISTLIYHTPHSETKFFKL